MLLFHFDVRIAMSQFSWIRMKMGIKEKLLEHLPGDQRMAVAGSGSCNVPLQQAFPEYLRDRVQESSVAGPWYTGLLTWSHQARIPLVPS